MGKSIELDNLFVEFSDEDEIEILDVNDFGEIVADFIIKKNDFSVKFDEHVIKVKNKTLGMKFKFDKNGGLISDYKN